VSWSWRAAVMRDRIEKGQFQFARFSWYADYPDPENFVFLLYGPNRRPGPNGSAYDSPEYNRLFEQVRAMDDSPERLALLRKMRDVAVEDCPLVYLYHKQALGLTYGWVGSAKPHPIANDFSKYWRVDGPVRAARQTEWNRPNYWPILAALLFLIAGSVPAVAAVRGRSRRRARRS